MHHFIFYCTIPEKKIHYTLVSHNRKYSELICLRLEWAEHTLTHLSKNAIGVFF